MGTIGGGNHFTELQAIEKVREANCPRHVHANFLPRAGELLSQMIQRTINVTQYPRGLAKEKISSWSDADVPCRALEQLDAKAALDTLHLSCNGALGQPGDFSGLGEAPVLHDQMKQCQFIQIEWNGATRNGHVAIVTRVTSNSVEIIQQNILGKTRDQLWLTKSNEFWFIASTRLPAGWLRMP